jgi:alpha-L-arabinofuranosidase
MERARIKVDLDRRIGKIDRKVYGNFVEHLGRCVYGGIYEENSPLSDERGFRLDVLQAVKGLNVPVLRWPGGNFVSGYHWQDGVGPKENRPRRMDLAWHAEESNRFGTDEFMEYCRELGTEPYLCVNLGTGTIEEAAAWVEYCNGTGDTYYANMRRANGHLEPYRVKYWGLGNEMYGFWQLGAKSAEDYAKLAVEAAKVMKWTDPSIELVSCGVNGVSDWDRIVLEKLAPYVQYHSIHLYTGDTGYYANICSPAQADRCLRSAEAIIDQVRWKLKIEKPIYIAYDEWNQMYRPALSGPEHEYVYSLADALAVASYLNIFQRHAKSLKMANLAQLVNVIAPIFTSPEGMFRQTIYYPLALYTNFSQDIALDVWVDSPQIAVRNDEVTCNRDHRIWELSPFSMLDVSASVDEFNSELSVAVINRSRDETITAELQVAEHEVCGGTVYLLNGSDVDDCNNFETPNAVTLVERPLAESETLRPLNYTFPAHSLTFMRLKLDDAWTKGRAQN